MWCCSRMLSVVCLGRNPFVEGEEERLIYRTGDLCRWRDEVRAWTDRQAGRGGREEGRQAGEEGGEGRGGGGEGREVERMQALPRPTAVDCVSRWWWWCRWAALCCTLAAWTRRSSSTDTASVRRSSTWHCPCASLEEWGLSMRIIRPRRPGCPCASSAQKATHVLTHPLPPCLPASLRALWTLSYTSSSSFSCLPVSCHGRAAELGEIEKVLQAYPDVGTAVVLCRDDCPMGRALVAYIKTGRYRERR